MVFEFMGTRSSTGKRVKARVHAHSRERAIERLTKEGVTIDPDPPAPPSASTVVVANQPSQESASEGSQAAIDAEVVDRKYSPPPSPDGLPTVPRMSVTLFPIPIRTTALIVIGLLASTVWTASMIFALKHIGGAVWSHLSSADGRTHQKSAEELARERIAQQTMICINKVISIDRQYIAPFDRYGGEMAELLVREYGALPFNDIDPEWRAWCLEVQAAAKDLLNGEKERRDALSRLESSRDANAVGRAIELGEAAGRSGKTVSDQLGRAVVGGVLGGLAGNLETNLQQASIQDRFNRLLSENSRKLKGAYERRNAVTESVCGRYGWKRADR